MHNDVHVFVHDGDWFLEFAAECGELGEDHRSKSYGHRPRLCRDYGDGDTECEAEAEPRACDVHFSTAEAFEEYLDAKGIDWRWKRL